jgi:hypothetical protein
MNLAAYGCAPNVVWSIERRGIRLLNTGSRASQMIPYPQAAIWELVCRHVPIVPEKMAAIAGIPPADVERLVSESVEQWLRDGFLQEAGR